MKIKLLCRDDEECPSDIKPFMIEIDEETVMDINNIATVFCPFCNRAMNSPEHSDNGSQRRQGAK